MVTRRTFLRTLGLGAAASVGLSSYSVAEPRLRLVTTRYNLNPVNWPAGGAPLRIAALADLHACDPWMPVERIEAIVEQTNRLKPDVTVLLGDYVTGAFPSEPVASEDWGRALGKLEAPLGVYAVLGNHDWWTDLHGVRKALSGNGIRVMENEAVLIPRTGATDVWLAGLGDQLAHRIGRGKIRGADDMPGTLRQIKDDGAPAILMAHEPDIFPRVPDRFSLTLSGHTHGGQVALPVIGRPVMPTGASGRYAYGHIHEGDRHLVVSGGLGCSSLPIRFGVPPEVVLIEVGEGLTSAA